jgi:hypothetical protein
MVKQLIHEYYDILEPLNKSILGATYVAKSKTFDGLKYVIKQFPRLSDRLTSNLGNLLLLEQLDQEVLSLQ